MFDMDDASPRELLDRLIRERGTSYGALSGLIGRNPAYIQQYVKRGTPRKLDEEDRRKLARFLGVAEHVLGGPEEKGVAVSGSSRFVAVPRLSLRASAGSGSLDEDERTAGVIAFDERWLRDRSRRPDSLSIIRVDGASMAPTLSDGDDIMVDRSDGAGRLRDGIYVLRLEDVLMVKRVELKAGRDRFSVRSDNVDYPDWENVDPAVVVIVGRVIWAGCRIS